MDAPIFPSNDTNATCLATEACFCECSVHEDCENNVCYKPPGPINPMTGQPVEVPGICAGSYDYLYAAYQEIFDNHFNPKNRMCRSIHFFNHF